jgi:hypothetical protein
MSGDKRPSTSRLMTVARSLFREGCRSIWQSSKDGPPRSPAIVPSAPTCRTPLASQQMKGPSSVAVQLRRTGNGQDSQDRDVTDSSSDMGEQSNLHSGGAVPAKESYEGLRCGVLISHVTMWFVGGSHTNGCMLRFLEAERSGPGPAATMNRTIQKRQLHCSSVIIVSKDAVKVRCVSSACMSRRCPWTARFNQRENVFSSIVSENVITS